MPKYYDEFRIHDKKNNLKIKFWIILLIFIIAIPIFMIIFANYYDIQNQSNIHIYKEILTEQNSDEEAYSNIDIKTLENKKRILADTQINTWTAGSQMNPKVSSLSDGNFVVVWQSILPYVNCCWGIYGQIFYSNGAKKGNEFHVSNSIALNQIYSNVAASSSGKFLVVWLQQSDGNFFGQIFTNDGIKLNDQFQINTNINLNIETPSIIALKNNNFIVVWNIYFQIFTDTGTKIGSEFNLTYGNLVIVAALANGNFVAAYRCYPSICAKIFYCNGTMLKSEFIVNTYINIDYLTTISSVSTSDFLIVWMSQSQDIIGNSDYGIYGQSFTSSGVKIGNEFRVNTYIIGDQRNPSITSLENNNYIVTWESNLQDGSAYGIYGQILDNTGNKIGNEFKINVNTNSEQQFPSLSPLLNTNFVVVWESYSQDGSDWGIFGNIYQNNGLIVGFDTCPLNCQSCNNKENCITCNPNYKLELNGLCGCFDGFYLDNMFDFFCVSKFIILN